MHSYEVGARYYFRTISFNWIGTIMAVTATDILLDAGAACVFEEGHRYSQFLLVGPNNESEIEASVGKVVVNRSAIVDAAEWRHNIPATQ